MQQRPGQIDSDRSVQKAEQHSTQEDVPADVMRCVRGRHGESLLNGVPLQQGATRQDDHQVEQETAHKCQARPQPPSRDFIGDDTPCKDHSPNTPR